MKIYKKSQTSPTGGKKIKINIVFDFANGGAKLAFADGQFGKGGGPCTKALEEIIRNMPDVEEKSISTAGYSDRDSSKDKPVDVKPQEQSQETPQFAPQQVQQR